MKIKNQMENKNYVILQLYAIYIIYLIIWVISVLEKFRNNYENIIYTQIIISLVINTFCFCVLKKNNLTNISFLFVLISYAFMFGHVFTSVYNLKTVLLWHPGDFFSEKDKLYSAAYALLSLNCIALGSFLVKRPSIKEEMKIATDYTILKMKNLGWFLFIIGFISNFISSIQGIVVVLIAGNYSALYNVINSGFLDDFGFFMVPGFSYIMYSKTLSKQKSFLFTLCVSIYYILLMIFSGSRRLQLFALIVVILCYIQNNKKGKKSIKSAIFIFISGILFLDLLYVIRENRTNIYTILPSFFRQLRNFDFLRDLIGESFAETGISFYSVVAITSTVPTVFPYEFGMTFLRTIPSVLPIGWLLGGFFNKAVSTQVINKYTGLPVGSSLIGDFYWNFGFIGGLLCSVLLGFFIEFLSVKLLYKEKNKPLLYSFMYVMFIGIRSGIFEIFRPMLMVLIIPYIFSILRIKLKKN